MLPDGATPAVNDPLPDPHPGGEHHAPLVSSHAGGRPQWVKSLAPRAAEKWDASDARVRANLRDRLDPLHNSEDHRLDHRARASSADRDESDRDKSAAPALDWPDGWWAFPDAVAPERPVKVCPAG